MEDFIFVGEESEEIFSHARDLEILIQELFTERGYAVTDVSGRGERGADFLASRNNKKIVVQVKCSTRSVRKSAVRQAMSAKIAYGADEAVVVSNSKFSPQARLFARQERVTLYGGEKLLPMFSGSQIERFREIERRALELAPRIARF